MANSILTLGKLQKAETNMPVEDVTSPEDPIFMNVMKPGDEVKQQSLSTVMKIGDLKNIIVGEIFHPHKFWIQFKGGNTSEALEKLMSEMDTFYDQVETAKMFQVPDEFLVSGLICATLFDGRFHRAQVTSVHGPTSVCLFYIDYGTITKVAKDSILYLDKRFSELPAQAIPSPRPWLSSTRSRTSQAILLSISRPAWEVPKLTRKRSLSSRMRMMI